MSFDRINNFRSLIREQNKDLLGKITQFKFTKEVSAADEFPLHDNGNPYSHPMKVFTTPSGLTYKVYGHLPRGAKVEMASKSEPLSIQRARNARSILNALDEYGTVAIISDHVTRRDRPGSPMESKDMAVEKEIYNHFTKEVMPNYSNIKGVYDWGNWYSDPSLYEDGWTWGENNYKTKVYPFY